MGDVKHVSEVVTVLLPVRDGAPWLAPAIGSILGQTHREVELLVLDDGSRDQSLEIAASFKDSRVVIDEHPHLAGRAARLNDGIDLASGAFLARMDADDIAEPTRFRRQLDHLWVHRDLAIVGSRMRTFGYGRSTVWRPPAAHDDIAAELLFRAPLAHPTVMFDARQLRQVGLRYDPELTGAEDWDLWLRARHVLGLGNMEDVLLRYRVRPPGAAPPDNDDRVVNYRVVARRCLEELGVDAGADAVDRHRRVAHHHFLDGEAGIDEAEAWLSLLLDANAVAGVYPFEALRRAASRWWFDACYLQAGRLGARAWRRYRSSPLAGRDTPAARRLLRFGVRVAQSVGRRS